MTAQRNQSLSVGVDSNSPHSSHSSSPTLCFFPTPFLLLVRSANHVNLFHSISSVSRMKPFIYIDVEIYTGFEAS